MVIERGYGWISQRGGTRTTVRMRLTWPIRIMWTVFQSSESFATRRRMSGSPDSLALAA